MYAAQGNVIYKIDTVTGQVWELVASPVSLISDKGFMPNGTAEAKSIERVLSARRCFASPELPRQWMYVVLGIDGI